MSKFGVMFFDEPAAAFGNICVGVRAGGRLAFLCWQDDQHNEVFGILLGAFPAGTRLPSPSRDALFEDPRRVSELLSGTGWEDVRTVAVNAPAWMGSVVAAVVSYDHRLRVDRHLVPRLG